MNVRDLFFNTIYDRIQMGEDICLVTSDLAAPSLDKFRQDFPNRYISVGIAEQNMIAVASGMAATGQKTVAWGLNPFVVTRAFDQIRNTVSLMQIPLVFTGYQAGLSSALSGPTQVAISDLSLVRTLPYIDTYNPSDIELSKSIFDEVLNFKNPTYVRFDKDINYSISRKDASIASGISVVKEGGGNCVIVSTGRHVEYLSELLEHLNEEHLNPTLIDVFKIPCNKNALIEEIRKYNKVITVEEHVLQGGLGSYVMEMMSDKGILLPVKRIGINIEDGYTDYDGGREYYDKYFHLDKKSLYDYLVKELNEN